MVDRIYKYKSLLCLVMIGHTTWSLNDAIPGVRFPRWDGIVVSTTRDRRPWSSSVDRPPLAKICRGERRG